MDDGAVTGVGGLLSSVALAPLWVPQGIYLRLAIERLEPAAGPSSGRIAGEHGALRIAVYRAWAAQLASATCAAYPELGPAAGRLQAGQSA